jgi:hypothetical protein
MSVTIKGREYDYTADCNTCAVIASFDTQDERVAWLKNHHGHEVDTYLQGRV